MSKIITSPRIDSSRVPIGFTYDTKAERMVPEEEYLNLKQSIQTRVDKSYQEGFEKGKNQGFQEGNRIGKTESDKVKSELNGVIEQFKNLINQVNQQKNNIYITAEEDLVRLAVLLTEKVIGKLADENKELIVQTIKKSLPLLVEKSKLVIKVSPQQEEFIRTRMDDILALDKELMDVKIEADRRISQGGCILETTAGRVNACLEHQIEVLEEMLKKQIPGKEN